MLPVADRLRVFGRRFVIAAGAGAHVVGDPPTVAVSRLYLRGEPFGQLVLKHVCNMGRFQFTVVPEDNWIKVATAWRPPLGADVEHHEQFTEVEWVPWAFDSRRPYILCGRCLASVLRGFLTTYEPFGALYCRRCASVRYSSQAHLSEVDRLTVRVDSIRVRLGGQPAEGVLRTPVPRKPPRMHWKTYDQLIVELYALENELADAKEERWHMVLDKAYADAQANLARGLAEIERLEKFASRVRKR